MERVPAVEGLFTEEGGATLLGSKCATCGTVYFPKTAICHSPKCEESKVEDFGFGGKGTLWSYSIQDFPPPPPHKFDKPYEIYALGVVDFPAGVRVMGQMSIDNLEDLKVGSDVELVIEPLYHEDDKEFTSWKFKQL
jgi:uncharacterized OB-fold protein